MLDEYKAQIWAAYTERADQEERQADAKKLRDASALAESVYATTSAGFVIEDPVTEAMDLLDDAADLLDPPQEEEV